MNLTATKAASALFMCGLVGNATADQTSTLTPRSKFLVGDSRAHFPSIIKPIQAATSFSLNVLSQHVETCNRPTTAVERLMGDLRRYGAMTSNWDGEGAVAPDRKSIEEAVRFVTFLGAANLPEPMLHSSGRVGLYWNSNPEYGDVEFLGDGRIAYYIEHEGEGKHKGIVRFNKRQMPAVLQALLQT